MRDGLRFALVGAAATTIHLGVALAALSLGLSPLAANTIGFLSATGLSVVAHHRISFPGRVAFRQGAARFLPAAVLGFAANTAVLATLDQSASSILPAWLRIAISAAVIPIVTFLYARYYAYRPRSG